MIRLRVLAPVAVVLTILAFITAAAGYMVHRRWIYHDARELATFYTRVFDVYVDGRKVALTGFLDVIKDDPELQKAWLAKDRDLLLKRSLLLEDKVKYNFKITHFYFHDPERRNFLRVYDPPRHGDIVDRISLLQAEKTGKTTSGIETGSLGSLTLRVVLPWVIDGKIAGYIEAGDDISEVIRPVDDDNKAETLIVVEKGNVTRERWERGMKVFGHSRPYDFFPNLLVAASTLKVLPEKLKTCFNHPGEDKPHEHRITIGDEKFYVASSPIKGFFQSKVGEFAVLRNVTSEERDMFNLLKILVVGYTLGGGLLTILFSVYLRRIDKKLEASQKALEDMAVHDPLTGLYNRAKMVDFMKHQFAMQTRDNAPISVVMLDLDFFKKVNDLHGHQAGDAVLSETAKRLTEIARETDLVSRHGGEEFLFVLPQTGMEGALSLAERARRKIESKEFPTDVEGKTLKVTASFGVSEKTKDDDFTIEQLIEHADKALYRAKTSGRNRVCAMEKQVKEST
ncbi:diguanylate cyclase [bacterium]|nr:MAG: diguanylate cyclase [bacterium]